jgi:hypothetical protein
MGVPGLLAIAIGSTFAMALARRHIERITNLRESFIKSTNGDGI